MPVNREAHGRQGRNQRYHQEYQRQHRQLEERFHGSIIAMECQVRVSRLSPRCLGPAGLGCAIVRWRHANRFIQRPSWAGSS